MPAMVDLQVGAIPRETADFARSVLSASASTFFWIGADGDIPEFHTTGSSLSGWEGDYLGDAQRYDPLDPRRLLAEDTGFAIFSLERARWPEPDVQRYRRFQDRYGVVDEIEFILRKDEEPFAGLCVLKLKGDPPFSHEATNYDAMLRYFSFNLSQHPRVKETALRRSLAERYNLTGRELEVVDLIRNGAANVDVAEIMGIGVATVKTHLFNVFNKLGVDSRGAAIAFCGALKVAS